MSWGAGVVIRVLATAVTKSTNAARAAAVASLSVAEHLMTFVGMGLAKDVAKLKTDYLMKSKADATIANAKAMRAMAEGVEAANLEARRQEQHALEMQILQAKARIAGAHADVITAAAEEAVQAIKQRDEEEVDAARERLEAAIRQLNARGGQLYVSPSELPAGLPEITGQLDVTLDPVTVNAVENGTSSADVRGESAVNPNAGDSINVKLTSVVGNAAVGNVGDQVHVDDAVSAKIEQSRDV